MSGVEPIVAAEVAATAAGTAEAAAAAEALAAMEAAAAAEAATAAQAAAAAETATSSMAAMEAATAASSASNTANPYIMNVADKTALFRNIGYADAANTAAASNASLNPYVMTSADKAALLGNTGYAEVTNAAAASNAANPYIMSSADKAALLSNTGYGPGMSGFQTSVFDTTLGLTGSPQLAAALTGGGSNQALGRVATNMATNAMRPKQQTTTSMQLARGRPQMLANPIAGLLDQAKRKRRPISLL